MDAGLVFFEATGALVAAFGFGLTCSAVISKRFSDVPSGVQVMSVSIGLLVS